MAEKKRREPKKQTQDDKLFAFWDIKEQRKFARDFGKTIGEVRAAAMAVGKDGKPGRSVKDIAAYLLNHPAPANTPQKSLADINELNDIDTNNPFGKLLATAIVDLMNYKRDQTPAQILSKLKDTVLLSEM